MEETRRSFIGKVIGFLGIAAFIPKSLFANSKQIEFEVPWPIGDGGVKLKKNPLSEDMKIWTGERVDQYCDIFKYFLNSYKENKNYTCTKVYVGPHQEHACVSGIIEISDKERFFSFICRRDQLFGNIVKYAEISTERLKYFNCERNDISKY